MHTLSYATEPHKFPVPEIGVMLCHGPQSADFLQGQATFDAKKLSANQTTNGAFCDVKGQMLSQFKVVKSPESSFYFVLPKINIPPLIQHLKKYKAFFKCTLEDISHNLMAWVYINASEKEISEHEVSYPLSTPSISLCLKPFEERYEQTDNEYALWRNGLHTLADSSFVLSTELQGLLPQHVNLPAQKGVSFKKGCFTGQEIITRTQTLGKVKKIMVPFELEDQNFSMPLGSQNWWHQDRSIKVTVLSFQEAAEIENKPSLKASGLCVISTTALDLPLFFDEANKKAIRLLPLPYTINPKAELQQ